MRAVTTVLLALAVAGCSVPRKPIDVVTGEACWRCKHLIADRKIAGEFVPDRGFAQKFRTVHCMSTWIAQQKQEPDGTFYVADYPSGKWIRAQRGSFVRTIVNRNTMELDYLAFLDETAAQRAATEAKTRVESWDEVLALGRLDPLGGN